MIDQEPVSNRYVVDTNIVGEIIDVDSEIALKAVKIARCHCSSHGICIFRSIGYAQCWRL